MNPGSSHGGPSPPPPPGSTSGSEYFPSDHLKVDFFLNLEEIDRCYKEFHGNVGHAQRAPKLVFEAFLTHIGTVLGAKIKGYENREMELLSSNKQLNGELEELKMSQMESDYQWTAYTIKNESDQLKAENWELKSRMTAMEQEYHQQTNTLESYKNEVYLRNVELEESKSRYQRQTNTLGGYKKKSAILQTSKKSLKKRIKFLRSECYKQRDILVGCKDANTALQSSNSLLKEEIGVLELKISEMEGKYQQQTKTIEGYVVENAAFKQSNKQLKSKLDWTTEDMENYRTGVIAHQEEIAAYEDRNKKLQSLYLRADEELGGQIRILGEYKDANSILQSENSRLNKELEALISRPSEVEQQQQARIRLLEEQLEMLKRVISAQAATTESYDYQGIYGCRAPKRQRIEG